MTRPKVAEPPVAASVTTARPEHLAALKLRGEDERVGGRNTEPFAVHLGVVEFDVFVHPVGDRTPGLDTPAPLCFGGLTPLQRTGATHQSGERLQVVIQMEDIEAYRPADPLTDAINKLMLYRLIRGMTPPREYVGVVKHRLGQAVVGLAECGRLGLEAGFAVGIGDDGMNPL